MPRLLTAITIFIIISISQGLGVESNDPLPINFSWANVNNRSYLTHIYNQNFPKPCNSGWAFATLNALNARIKIRRNATSPDVVLSTQVLLSCDEYDFGCLGVIFN